MAIVSLNSNEEYQKLLPPLPKDEYEALKTSIKEKGLYSPITVNNARVILDGYHRYKACVELGIEPKYEVREFANQLLEKAFVVEVNLQRRHLNDFQKVELSLPLEEIEAELAKQRVLEHGRTQQPLGSNEPGGRARDIVAKKIGVSPTTFQRAKVIIDHGSEKLKESLRKGKMSIAYAYEMIKKTEGSEGTPPLPEGVFNVIYADPPWEYFLPLRGSPNMHYQTMTTEEICKLKVPAAENAVLFLWATNPKLEDALKVMNAWGFEYKTNMVWVKDKVGTGYYFRGQHELLLVGKKGGMSAPLEENRPHSVLVASREKHSHKPQAVYELIEKMYPGQKYLELFGTEKRKGWVTWGYGTQ